MAQGQQVEAREIAWACNRGNDLAFPRAGVSMGWHLPDRQEGLDIVVHALQRRLRNFDPGRFLRADRMERMAAMGVPAGGSGNELDCRLCDELDYVDVLRERLRSPPWRGGSRNGR